MALSASAQCPDGSPPPCRGTTIASAVQHRLNPALNEREWIVVPFANVMRAQDLDWLREASASGDYVRACATLRSLVAKDSSDVEALYGVGECDYHGGLLPPEPTDSVHGRFRSNWNIAIAVFRRVLLLDPL